MSKSIGAFVVLSIAALFAGKVFADSSVSLHNEVNTSSNTTASSQCHTSIHMSVNGQEQDSESTDCNHDINVRDGNNSVHISNNIGQTIINNPSVSPRPTNVIDVSPSVTSSPKAHDMQKINKQALILQKRGESHQSLWTTFTSWLEHLFSNKPPQ